MIANKKKNILTKECKLCLLKVKNVLGWTPMGGGATKRYNGMYGDTERMILVEK